MQFYLNDLFLVQWEYELFKNLLITFSISSCISFIGIDIKQVIIYRPIWSKNTFFSPNVFTSFSNRIISSKEEIKFGIL